MFTTNYPLYTIHFPKYWLIRDEPIKKAYSSTEEDSHRTELLFHISQNDYLSTLATVLRFFEEAIYKDHLTPEMKEMELKTIRTVIDDLLYINKNFTIVPQKKEIDK
ncbi:MAG: hypothetical protein WCS86_03415 [Candidatus Paceibacterota bacterium]